MNKAEHTARWEQVERAHAQALISMTEQRALEVIKMLGDVENPWTEKRMTSGLVEQQAFFHRRDQQ